MKMLSFMFSFALVMLMALPSIAQVPAPLASPAPVVAPVAPAPVVVQAPAGSVAVQEPAAPPKWAEDVIMSAQKLPIIGPIVSKVLLYAGIVSSILTGLVAFLLASLSALSGVMNVAGLAGLAEKLQLFKNGKIMYWLSYLSMFNAKKPESKDGEIKDLKSVA